MALTSCSLASCSALPLVDAPAPAASASSLSPGFFSSSSSSFPSKHCSVSSRNRSFVVSCSATKEKTKEKEKENEASSAEEITRKYGLEAGLWKIFTSKDETAEGSEKSKGSEAKELLARYGGAYLATSISLSAISFGLCYVLVNSGVDVASLLQKIGIESSETGEKVGTFALAYAAHKAASPIRFPPTVALTPIVARWFGKKDIESSKEKDSS